MSVAPIRPKPTIKEDADADFQITAHDVRKSEEFLDDQAFETAESSEQIRARDPDNKLAVIRSTKATTSATEARTDMKVVEGLHATSHSAKPRRRASVAAQHRPASCGVEPRRRPPSPAPSASGGGTAPRHGDSAGEAQFFQTAVRFPQEENEDRLFTHDS